MAGLFVAVVEVSGQESRASSHRCEGPWGLSCACKVWWSDTHPCPSGRLWRACRAVAGAGLYGGLHLIPAGATGGRCRARSEGPRRTLEIGDVGNVLVAGVLSGAVL